MEGQEQTRRVEGARGAGPARWCPLKKCNQRKCAPGTWREPWSVFIGSRGVDEKPLGSDKKNTLGFDRYLMGMQCCEARVAAGSTRTGRVSI